MARNILIVSLCIITIFGFLILSPWVIRTLKCSEWSKLAERDKIRAYIANDLSKWSDQISKDHSIGRQKFNSKNFQQSTKKNEGIPNNINSKSLEVHSVAAALYGVEVKFYPPLAPEHFFIQFENASFLKAQHGNTKTESKDQNKPKLLAHVFFDKENPEDRKVMIQYEIHSSEQNLISQTVQIHDLGKCQ